MRELRTHFTFKKAAVTCGRGSSPTLNQHIKNDEKPIGTRSENTL